MTIAEKYYRMFYRVKPDQKLTKEQWKVVRMMHACLKENNKPKLPPGAMIVNRKALVAHLNIIQQAVNDMDAAYDDKGLTNDQRGKALAKVRNTLEYSTHGIKHFELRIPLSELNGTDHE